MPEAIMGGFVLRRLIQMVPLLLGITFLTFAIVNLVPGSPIAAIEFNPRATPADVQRIKENLGLDRPWPERYVYWLADVVRGDLGISLINYTPVTDRILNVLPNTLLLTISSLTLALGLSIPLGLQAAVKRNSAFDYLLNVATTVLYAMPTFWFGLLLILLFAVKFNEWGLPALPVGGMLSLRGESGLLDRIEHLILPAVALAGVQLASWTRYIRSSVLEVVRLDFVRTAEAKGLRERTVLYGHAFRNALLPLVTLIGLTLPELFGGALLIETIYAWNGVGRLAYDAALSSDYTLIMGTVLMFAVLTLVANLLSDVAYALLDPRIRYD
ncbi:MAG TPA: ABC transporter permease [Thermomicrobiales bacterium]|nr:ABC transporter permease [Thermomicrobiales bacterium]